MTATPNHTHAYYMDDHDVAVTLRQIGHGNVLAISGGRHSRSTDGALILPVAHGYRVEVFLDPSDTYRVERTFRRGERRWVKATWSNVYADQVGEVAYRASCYLDTPEGADQ
jgi:hypothetical protein